MQRAGLTDWYLSLPDYLQGKMKVDEYVTHEGYTVERINDAFNDMHVNGSFLVSGSCLTVFSRNPIASVLSSTCHKIRKNGGEKTIVVLFVEYECSSMVSNSSCTRDVIVASQYTHVPSRLLKFALDEVLFELHSRRYRNKLIARRNIDKATKAASNFALHCMNVLLR